MIFMEEIISVENEKFDQLACILMVCSGIWGMEVGPEFLEALRRLGSKLASQPWYFELSVNETKVLDHI